MATYKVEWEQQIDNASSPLNAAQVCADEMESGESFAFTVTNLSTGERFSVDLNKGDEGEVVQLSND